LAELIAEGWAPTVITTPAGAGWVDSGEVARLTGSLPRSEYRAPNEPKQGGDPAAVVVFPATFNTVNKAAVGAMDTYALGVLCEAIGTGTATVAVPMVNDKLWGHPAWKPALTVLQQAGVILVDVQTGELELTAVPSGTGGDVVAAFDPRWVTRRLKPAR
jgi:hypothetical protein